MGKLPQTQGEETLRRNTDEGLYHPGMVRREIYAEWAVA